MLFNTLPPVPPTAQVQAAPAEAFSAAMEALLKAKDWAGLADWFESATPSIRGKHYDVWLQSLNRSRRWARLVEVCEALQPQLEAKSGPRLGIYRLYRAQGLGQLGRHAEAAFAYMEVARLGGLAGFTNACSEAQLGEDWDDMLAWSEEWLQKYPGDAAGQAWLGDALAHQGKLVEAEAYLRAAVEKDPKLAYAWNNLGRCLNLKKAWAEARTALTKSLALEPGQVEPLMSRGKAQFELGQYAESRDDFRAALALRPGDPVLQENLRQAERYLLTQTPKKAPGSGRP